MQISEYFCWMIRLSFPAFNYKIKTEQSKELIFDECRKQWVTLTPEEWVRQNVLQYLAQTMQYPPSLIAVEKEINLGELKKRFDIVVYKNAKPWLMVECKEMNVPLNELVIRQILNYNIALQVKYLVVTNGNATYALQIAGGVVVWLDNLPQYDSHP